jgi:DNA (cytosine-5)-methyltransferase 1
VEEKMNELALFAGAGGGILGGTLLGWRTVCAVECDAYAASVLAQRQNDGLLPPFPIWSDVRSFDGKSWRGIVDIISGGFPCQDISVAGNGVGITGERSGLWKEFARIIGEVRPIFVYVENSPMLTSRGLGTVLGDLAALGYNAEWGVLGARDVGAPHKRERIWILAHSMQNEFFKRNALQIRNKEWKNDNNIEARENRNEPFTGMGANMADSDRSGCEKFHAPDLAARPGQYTGIPFDERRRIAWWDAEPGLGRVANGVAHRVDRLEAIGNGQVPAVAATAFRILSERLNN